MPLAGSSKGSSGSVSSSGMERYTWHLSLRVDRPVEGCTIRPHAYMYSKKLDDRDVDKPLPPHSKKCRDPPPHHEFVYRWFRGPRHEPCAYAGCPRRTSFSPHDWSKHALGGSGCSLQCVSTQSSLYRSTFCNSRCFLEAWKTQRTVPRGEAANHANNYGGGGTTSYGNGINAGGGGASHSMGAVLSSPPPQDRMSSVGSYGSAPSFQQQQQQQVPPPYLYGGGRGQSTGSYVSDDVSVGSVGSAPGPGGGGPPHFIPASSSNNSGGVLDGSAFGAPPSTPTSTGATMYGNYADNTYTNNPGTADYDTSNNDHSASAANAGPAYNDANNNVANAANNSNNDSQWMEISRDQYHVPTEMDLGRKLLLEATAISVDTGEILMQRAVKTDLVLSRAPDPTKRNLITVKGGASGAGAGAGGAAGSSANAANGTAGGGTTAPPPPPQPPPPTGPGGARFRIVTYNVLAEIYATQQQYPYCDFWALSWDYRFQNILRELMDVQPDVICLQEVQADHYSEHLYNALSEVGFDGVYKQKTRASMGLAGKVDGCALFWRRTKFHLVETYSMEFNELAQRHASQVLGLNPRSEEGVAYLNRLSRDNVAQLVVLELVNPTLPTRSNREPINQLCVANTHLYSHKDCPDVKLWQTWQLMQELESFVLSRAGTTLPLLICGDFNSTPDTAVYDLMSRQAVHPGHPDVNLVNAASTEDGSPPAPPTNVLPDALAMTHSFQLGSVYQTVMGEEPQYTNFTKTFKGVLDYMWYTVQFLRPLSAAPIPEEEELARHGEALPSTQYSSDHIMLISDMQILYGPRPP